MSRHKQKPHLPVDPSNSTSLARQLLLCQRVMTLGTCSDTGAWTAPVYYILTKGTFFFFSNPDSRHIREALLNNTAAAASVFSDAPRASNIKGIQMSGRVERISDPVLSAGIAVSYVKQHKIAIEGNSALAFLNDRFRARLFAFTPTRMMYMDNSIRFGFREQVTL